VTIDWLRLLPWNRPGLSDRGRSFRHDDTWWLRGDPAALEFHCNHCRVINGIAGVVIQRNPLVVAPQTEVLSVIAHLGLESVPWPLHALLDHKISNLRQLPSTKKWNDT